MHNETTSTMNDPPPGRGDTGRSSAVGTWFVVGGLCLLLGSAILGCATAPAPAPVASDPFSLDRLKMGPSRYETGRMAPMRVSNPGGEISPARAGELGGSPSRPGAGAHHRHRRANGVGSRDPLALRGA